MKNIMNEMEMKQKEAWKKDQEEQFVLKNSLPMLIAEKMQNSMQEDVIKYINNIVESAFPGADTAFNKFSVVRGLIMEAKKLLPTDDKYGGLTKDQFEAMKKDITSKAYDGCNTEEEKKKRFEQLMGKRAS